MGDTIFKMLRLDENGMEKKIQTENGEVKLTQTKLAEIFDIDNGTLSNYERGSTLPTFDVIKKYHKYFNVPYETLFGEGGIAMKKENVYISQDLGLSDDAINTIRLLSPVSLETLNAFLSNDKYTDIFLSSFFQNLYNMNEYIEQPNRNKNDSNYSMLKYLLTDMFTEYVLNNVRNKLTHVFKKQKH